MMLPRLLAFALVFAVVAGCESETYVERLAPAALLGGFASHASRGAALGLVPPGLAARVVEDTSLPAGDGRPPFSIYTVAYEGFVHCGQAGELWLLFFNDRLQRTAFYPRDAAACLAELAARGLRLPEGGELVLGETLVRTGHDQRGRDYVAWEDRRLREQSLRWIRRYS